MEIPLNRNALGQRVRWETFLLTVFIILLGTCNRYFLGIISESSYEIVGLYEKYKKGKLSNRLEMKVSDRENEILLESYHHMTHS